MVSLLEAIFLGVLQGVTEWLPVSSSAHLALAQYYFGVSAPIAFDIMLHVGTLLAVLAFYRKRLLALAAKALVKNSVEQKMGLLLVLASIPTAVIGLAFKDFFASMFSQPVLIAVALIITGVWLYLASSRNGSQGVSTKSAFAIGVAQGIAVAPGISRSGATIGAALFAGVERKKAAEFSFLLSIPAIIGASMLEGRNAFTTSLDPLAVIAGVLASAVVGYLSIGFLLKLLEENKFKYFAYYCFVIAFVVLTLEFVV